MKRELWLRLREYQFDDLVPPSLLAHVAEAFGGADASTKAFADKLARKLHWSPRFALRAISEYKKFVYLGMVSDFAVTPAKFIDQVWHEHLLFTRGYRDFCNNVLGRAFDHNPELVPVEAQTGAFAKQYLQTLELYRTEFNTNPPADIWATPKFDANRIKADNRAASLKRKDAHAAPGGDTPLYTFFDGSSSSGGHSHESMPEFQGFGGGDGFSGGGGGESWSGDGGGDTASVGSGDSGGGDSGGSSCSSGCGGGGGD